MTPSDSSFLKTMCQSCLDWEATSDLPAAVKRTVSVVTVAQAALETGWGESWLCRPPLNNWGGIKWHISQWPGVVSQTREVIDGKSTEIHDSFQTYPTVADYVADHFTVLIRWKCVREAIQVGVPELCAALGPWTVEDRVAVNGGQPDASKHSNYSTDPAYSRTLGELVADCGLSNPLNLEALAAA